MTQEVLLWGIGMPAMLCAVILLAALQPWRGAGAAAERWAGANAIAAGMVASYLVVRDWQIDVPPREPWEWLAYLVVFAAIAIGYGVAMDGRGRTAWTAWILAAGLSAYLIVGPKVDQFWAWRMITAGMMLGAMTSLDRLQAQSSSGLFAISLALSAFATCILLNEARMETLAQLSGALAACLGILAIIGWWRPAVAMGSGGVLVVSVLLPGLAMSGYFEGTKMPAWCFVAAALAPAACWLAELPFAQRYVQQNPLAYRFGAILVFSGSAAIAALIIS